MKVTQKRQIIRIKGAGCQLVEDVLLKEIVYQFIVNGKVVMNFHCVPQNLEQLAIGHGLCQGWFTNINQIEELKINENKKQIFLSLNKAAFSNVLQPSTGEAFFSPTQIYALCEEFDKYCDLFRLTGASHSCALAAKDGIRIFMNDVARHNSLDKVIGEMVLQRVNPAEKAFIFSGRLALDMIEKVVISGVKILVAPGAPTLAAVELAEKSGLTLLGFVRKDNINIYTHWHRIY